MSEMWFKVMFPDKSTFRLISPLEATERERQRLKERERKRDTERVAFHCAVAVYAPKHLTLLHPEYEYRVLSSLNSFKIKG